MPRRLPDRLVPTACLLGVAVLLSAGGRLCGQGGSGKPAEPKAGGVPAAAGESNDAANYASLDELTAAAQAQRVVETAIRGRLSKRITVEFVDTPLKEALAHLEQVAGIRKLQVDETALKKEGTTLDAPVPFTGENVTVAQVLHRVLKPLKLTWIIENEALVVTTQVKADERLTTRVYAVGRLLKLGIEERKTALREETSPAVAHVADGVARPESSKGVARVDHAPPKASGRAP